MSSVISEIAKWGAELPFWEQMALDKIIAGEEFNDTYYDLLLQYLLEDEGLAEGSGSRPLPRFHRSLRQDPGAPAKIRLHQIRNLQNVNALIPGQTLTFGPALTVIFGANGSGKSGYARMIGSAGFTRGDREVLPDITSNDAGQAVLSADLVVEADGEERNIHYQLGKPCHELASFYVFDSTSVRIHMAEQNPLSFSPSGLSFLTRLAEETDKVRERLAERVDGCCEPCEIINAFQGESDVSTLLQNAGPDTDLEQLKILAHLTPNEKKRRSELNQLIANFELDQVKIQIDEVEGRQTTLTLYQQYLEAALEALGDSRIQQISQEIKHYQACQEIVSRSGEQKFASMRPRSAGSNQWRKFIDAAQALAREEADLGKPYPQQDDTCLLCQQPLSKEALRWIADLWDYLSEQSQDNLDAARKILQQRQQEINANALFQVATDFSTPSKYLGEYSPTLLQEVQQTVDQLKARQVAITTALETHSLVEDMNTLSGNCLEGIKACIYELGARLSVLEGQNKEEEVRKLEIEKLTLDHRTLLEKLYPQVEEYIRKRKWAQTAATIGGNTKHITSKHNALFKILVTNEYTRLFEQTLADLGRPLKVKMTTLGRKGQTLRQITLDSSAGAKELAKPEKVLSEGEKRAVALADFLTEVALDTNSNGIVLDDPVTSLDLEWRETIARLLTERARDKQVIIFTHDLPFLYYIKEKAEESQLQIDTHWIKRGDQDDKPGYVFLGNSPALDRQYRKPTRAQELYDKAKKAPAAEQEAILRNGFAALRTCYEAFIMFDLFNEVVMRFSERISPGRLKSIVWDNEMVAKIIEKHEHLSTCMEGHLHSAGLGAKIPTLVDLQREIDDYRAMVETLKDMKKKKEEM